MSKETVITLWPDHRFTVGIESSAGNDPDAAANVVHALVKASANGLFIESLKMGRSTIEVVVRPPYIDGVPAPTEKSKHETAKRLLEIVRTAHAGATVVVMGGWAFGSDKKELTTEQRSKVREEILSLLPESAPHEQALIKRIADKVGKR